jgi:hypothetical protein
VGPAMTDTRHDRDPSDGVDAPWRGTALRDLASELPTVAHALEDFIARANQTERAGVAWEPSPAATAASAQAAAELRDAAARTQALQHQLDELQAALAKAEARAPAAGDAPVLAGRAIDAPRPSAASRKLPWPAIVGSFVGGIVVMLAVSRLTRDEPRAMPATPAVASPMRSVVEGAAPRPTVTPIEPPPSAPAERPAPVEPPPAPSPPRSPRPAPPARGPVTPPAHAPAELLANPFDNTAPARPRAPAKPARPADPKASGQLVNPF